jgi:dipeptidyl-peptidase-4
MVDDVVGVDEARGRVYITATREHPTEQQLYAVPLEGGAPQGITHESGTHEVELDHACRRFVDRHCELDQPPVVTLRSLEDGAVLHTLHDRMDPRIERLDLRPPGLVEFKSRDGETLYGAIYVPSEAAFGPGPYPVIVSVYGGPHAQRVTHRWAMAVDMRAQYLRDRGFLVFKVDNRGSARRGLAFEAAIRHNLGDVEVQDQVDGVRWLVAQGLADPARVGIYGWSYGGYIALMCLARAPEVFKAAVAGAPVTHWDGYDTHYTERYMGTPQSNPEGYRESSVMAHADRIQGDLLLVHGLVDENVHFRHTARLINALIRARKPYELLLFPDERHMPRKLEDRVYMEQRIRDFFLAHL